MNLDSMQQDMEQVWQELLSIPELQVSKLCGLVILVIHYLHVTCLQGETGAMFKFLRIASKLKANLEL